MTTTRKALALLTGCVGAAAIVLACFSDRTSGPGNVAGECRVPVTVIDSMHYVIAIRGFAFHPDSLSVPTGATVTWINCEDAGTAPHTTTSDLTIGDANHVWNSPELSPGDRFSHIFGAAGGFPYHCTPHPFMTGKVVVQ